ncbi:MAG: DUF2971 domain-containing protein [Salinivirgaceae bacterium]|nr:DUF2971 domain-containing protein [Salinivirgaceae bacterium]
MILIDRQRYIGDLEKYGDKEYPEFLYKYRRADNKNDLMFLTEPIVYLSSPIKFEDDEKDCRLPKQYPNRKEDIIQLLKQDLHKKYSEWDDQKLTSEAEKIDSPLLHPEKIIEFERERQDIDNKMLGILSLTLRFDNEYMWEKYGGNSTGFCIKYDTNLLFDCTKGAIHSISYEEELPKIKQLEEYWMYSFLTNYFTKRTNPFCKEEEWRIYKRGFSAVDDENRRVPIAKECIKAVYLGTKMSDNYKQEITELVRNKYGLEAIDLSKGKL